MSLRHPVAAFGLTAGKLSSAEAGMLSLGVGLSSRGTHDIIEVAAHPRSRLGELAVGDELSVELGDVGSEELVWTGEVSNVRHAAEILMLEGLSKTVRLSRARKAHLYLDQAVADIVKDIASDVGTNEVENDVKLAAYAIDERRTLWEHLCDLAELTSADLGSSAQGQLNFVGARSGQAQETFRFGADVLSWQVGPSAPPAAPSIAAHGSASEQGSEKWHWIRRSPSAVGNGDRVRVVPSAATQDTAEALENARSARAKRRGVQGALIVVGRTSVRPGSLIDVKDLPGDAGGTLRVLEVQHFLSSSGFVTTLRVEGTGSAAGGLS